MGRSLSLVACFLLSAATSWAAQIPLVVNEPDFDLSRASPPSVNATGNLIFATASSLLQHWPNTRYRNGHNVVPGIVSPGTLLYHGRRDPSVPKVPDWTATDPEHSYMFCRAWMGPPSTGDNCWHLTFVATRPLNVLYFDGSSAAKVDGALDSQDAIVDWISGMHGGSKNEMIRIHELCKWGKKFGLDGFVRMEMDFEIMLCDFTAGVELVSMLNLQELVEPYIGPIFTPPSIPSVPKPSPFVKEALINKPDEVIFSGSWHNHFPGETRIHLDYSRLVSFYDTSLAPSLTATRFGQPRLQHRVRDTSQEDVSSFMQRLEEVLQRPHGQSTIDWKTILHTTIERFADRLENVQYFLNETITTSVSRPAMKRIQAEFSLMVQPFALLPLTLTLDDDKHSWASGIFKHCATTQTKYLHKVPHLSSSELVLLQAIEETNTEICRVVTTMWAQGVEAGLVATVKIGHDQDASLEETASKWTKSINQLMQWLDWGVWLKCRPACAYDHICYLPTWPFFDNIGQLPTDIPPDDESIINPQPRCVPRFTPLESLA